PMSFRAFSIVLWFLSSLFVLCVAATPIVGNATTLSFVGRMFSGPYAAERITPLLILLFFAWVLVELAIKKWRIDLEHAALKIFSHELSKATPQSYTPSTANRSRSPRALRRLDLIMDCKARGNAPSLHEGIPTAATLDAVALSAAYVPLHVYAWILPVLG